MIYHTRVAEAFLNSTTTSRKARIALIRLKVFFVRKYNPIKIFTEGVRIYKTHVILYDQNSVDIFLSLIR